MNIPSVIKLATALVALSISAHAAEVFHVKTESNTFPTTTDTLFNAVDESGALTNPYNTFGNPPDNGSGSAVTITNNFNGLSSVVNTGQQFTQGTTVTTYFGPKFYAGINRDGYKTQGGVMHNNGNGYRIRANSISAADNAPQVGTPQVGTPAVGEPGDDDYVPASDDYVPASDDYSPATGNGGAPLKTKAIFMFDADISLLSGAAGDNFIFNDTDTLYAKVSVPGSFNSGASLGTYRPMVKAKGPSDETAQYYAGTLWEVPSDHPDSSTAYDVSVTGADVTWTLMPDIEDDSTGAQVFVDTNLTVDTSDSATTVSGKFLTHITQVGFLLAADATNGNFNYGVREFTANASSVYAPHPSGIEWSQDFSSPVNDDGTFLTTANNKVYDGETVLTGNTHDFKWSTAGAGLTASPTPSTVTQSNGQIVLELNSRMDEGMVELYMIGPGTDNPRRVKPVSHETTFEIDLIDFRNGQADLIVQTRGHDGYVRSVLSPSGTVKYSTWMSNYVHTNFDNFNGPSSLRNNNNNPGIVIVDGGTFDPASTEEVTVLITGNNAIPGTVDNASGVVVMNAEKTAVESVTLTDHGAGYTALPTVTFSGGGMTVAPTVSFNFESGNVSNPNVVTASMRDLDGDYDGTSSTLELPGTLLNDDQVLTYIQSYDNADDSLSYYYSIDGSAPQFITKLTAAEHSPGGHGFFDVSTGNKWGQPNNQQALWFQYKQWGNPGGQTARVGINSVSVATSDDDRDGVINRLDVFPDDPLETADSDSDNVGNNSDQHEGYDDAVVAAINTLAQSAGDSTFSYYVTGNADSYSYSVGGGAITQEAYDAVVAEKVAAESAQATAEAAQATAEAALAAAPTLSEIEQTVMDARPGSTRIDVSDGTASITLTLEETSAVGDWSNPTTTEKTFEVSAPAGTSFYRFTD